MKAYFFILLIAVFAVSCSNRNDKSDAYGNFEATEITISSQANGELMEFDLTEGDKLQAGDLIGWIDTTDLHLKKQQTASQREAVFSKIKNLTAQIGVFEQQKVNVLHDKERIVNMFNDGAATQKQVDDVDGRIDVIQKQIESVKTQKTAVYCEMNAFEKQIDQIGEAIKKSVIINPVDGIVLSKYANRYEITTMGKPLYKIANLDEMKLKVYVSGEQLPDIRIGQKVEVLVDKNKTENRKLSGTLSWISETAEFTPKIIQTKEERVNLVYAVKILVKNDGTLKIGMPGEVNF